MDDETRRSEMLQRNDERFSANVMDKAILLALAGIAKKLDRTNILMEQLVEALRHMNKVR